MMSNTKTYDVLYSMVKKTAGPFPVNPNMNVVHKVIHVYYDTKINDETHGLLGFAFFSYFYAKCVQDSSTPGVVDQIPQEVFDIFGPLMLEQSSMQRVYTLLGTQSFFSRTHYFPHVAQLGKRLGVKDLDDLYLEYYTGFDPRDVEMRNTSLYTIEIEQKRMSRGYYDTAKFVSMEKEAKVKKTKMDQKASRKKNKDLVFCSGPTAHERGGLHSEVHGSHRVCEDCGLVLSSNFQHEEQFGEDGHIVQHMTKEPEHKPRLRRYETSAKTYNMFDQPFTVLDKHRNAFADAVDKLKASVYFKAFVKNIWDTFIDGGFSPSDRLSAKIIVAVYMIWRLTHPKEEHYLDFDFQMTQVYYFVLDDAKGSIETQMPNFFIPSKILAVKYQPNTLVHYGSGHVEHIVNVARATKKRVESMDNIKKDALRKAQEEELYQRQMDRAKARNHGSVEYVETQNKARTQMVSKRKEEIRRRAQAKNTKYLAKVNEANRHRLDKPGPVLTDLVPEFQINMRFYDQDVAYTVQVQDDTHISMLPSIHSHARVDVCVSLTVMFQKERVLPDVKLLYGAQRCKLVRVEDRGTRRKCMFFVQSYSAIRPTFQVECSSGLRGMELTMKPEGVVKELGPKTRARVCMFFVPTPLLLRPMWQNINRYLGNPVYSPLKILAQVKEEEEEEDAPRSKKRTKVANPKAKDVDSSDEEPF